MSVPHVIATDKAVELIHRLKQLHGSLMFHQSGVCCNGSQPMCFGENELKVGRSDVLPDEAEGCNFYMSRDQFEYWKHTQLLLDVTKGRGSSFSLEILSGVRFYIQSRVFSEEEMQELEAAAQTW